MAAFLRRLRRRDEGPPALELLAVEGDDRGERFTLEAARIRIGRGRRSREPGRIGLRDGTVSAEQARLRRRRDGSYELEPVAGTTNPTLLNDGPPADRGLRVGDRIRMGRVVLEVCTPAALQLQTQDHPLPGAMASLEAATTARIDVSSLATEPDTTQARPVPLARPTAEIEVLQGVRAQLGRRIPLAEDSVRIGRAADCAIRIDEAGVSRSHAELEWRSSEIYLRHHSRVNPTLVNGRLVEGECRLNSGDRIQLADRVVLQLRVGPDVGRGAPAPALAEGGSLQSFMEDKIERDALIEQQFRVEGSFLDVDIVDSYGMKAQEDRDAHIIVSFERFRAFVATKVVARSGHILNSNGDELMCFFEAADGCVQAGRDILDALPAFNQSQNLLRAPFRVRLGAHTGVSLVDRTRGVAYSEVLDVAGHLQKEAEINGMLVSEATCRCLSDAGAFERVGASEKDGVVCYRLAATPGVESGAG